MKEQEKTLWYDTEGTRFYLIPDNAALPEGRFLIQSVDGTSRKVNSYSIIHYEIKDETAKKILHDQWRQGAKEAALHMIQDAIDTGQLNTDQNIASLLEHLFNDPTPTSAIASNPDKYLDELYNVLHGLADLLEAEVDPNPKLLILAQRHLQTLNDSGQGIGIEFGTYINAILEQLGKNTNTQRKQQLIGIVKILRESASTLADTPDAIDLDAFVQRMETQLNTALDIQDDSKARQQREREYKEHADNAIANSLSKLGFKASKKR